MPALHTRLTLIRRSFCCLSFLAAGISTCGAAAAEYDLVIANGHVIDGTGSPWYGGDVGVKDGRIAAIGNLSSASRKKTIDAHGLIVAPGFIDMLAPINDEILKESRASASAKSRRSGMRIRSMQSVIS